MGKDSKHPPRIVTVIRRIVSRITILVVICTVLLFAVD